MIQLYQGIIQPMIECSDTSKLGSFLHVYFIYYIQGRKIFDRNTCFQILVSDKGFVFVVPMKRKYEVPLALKLFAKEIGSPDAIICDAAGEQKSKEVQKFCHRIGTTLRYLEESTPWANLSELYIGIIKEV